MLRFNALNFARAQCRLHLRPRREKLVYQGQVLVLFVRIHPGSTLAACIVRLQVDQETVYMDRRQRRSFSASEARRVVAFPQGRLALIPIFPEQAECSGGGLLYSFIVTGPWQAALV